VALKHRVQTLVNRLGYRIERLYPADFSAETVAVIERVRPHTKTSSEAIDALCSATRHLVHARVPGAIVECGVWRGGSMLAAALTLLREGDCDRELYLYDTFATEMPPASPADVRIHDALAGSNPVAIELAGQTSPSAVRKLLESSSYPAGRIHVVEGLVEETIGKQAPDTIALLRLDTDWYESTRYELEQLYPRLSPGGILIVDDYGHWAGARRAVDEYFARFDPPPFLGRVDYTVRLVLKPY
jgi:O-methyltransferase